jgi:hypothetical protein
MVTLESAWKPNRTRLPSIWTTVSSISPFPGTCNRIFSSLFLDNTSILPPCLMAGNARPNLEESGNLKNDLKFSES